MSRPQEKLCWYYYDAMKSLEDNKKLAQEKIKAKAEAKKNKKEEKKEKSGKDSPSTKQEGDKGGVPHKGTYAQLPPKTEQASMCLVQDALLYYEPCNMVGVRPRQVDFICDSGAVSGMIGEREMNILKNVAE